MSEHTTRAMPPAPIPEASMVLVVVEGVDAGKSVTVDEPILVGTSEACDLALTDRAVSRRHLSVSRGEAGVRVRDEDSRNGTWMGSTRVRDVELADGDEILIGTTRLRAEQVLTDRTSRPPPEPRRTGVGRFLGESDVLQPMYRALERVAPSSISVLLEGESGVGKELLAEAIHEQSSRKDEAFVVVDCGAIPPTLIESELLGHERGAFTGAESTRIGAFERADGGTVFLDEIGELPIEMQTRLLRVLDRRQIRRLGGEKVIDIDVRVVAATNRNLEREVEEGGFRLDLFHRLAVALIRVPPLREREGDIERLARAFGERNGIDPAMFDRGLIDRMNRQEWRGNVRELRNYVERLAILGELPDPSPSAPRIQPKRATNDALIELATAGLPYRAARTRLLDEFSRLYTQDMLDRHDGNVSRAAEAAQIARRHFQRLKSDPSADSGD
ncbi:MAG: sigma 54-interacting transcriptional regulator [Sandaracinaceae bacterium]